MHIEYMKMLKDEVRNCYRREGVNHYENCRDLVHEYYARTKAPSTRNPADPAAPASPPLHSLVQLSDMRRACLSVKNPFPASPGRVKQASAYRVSLLADRSFVVPSCVRCCVRSVQLEEVELLACARRRGCCRFNSCFFFVTALFFSHAVSRLTPFPV